MRLRHGITALITITDGTVLRGQVTRSWRWRVIRLIDASAFTPQGAIDTAGPVLIPYRSVLLAQEVATNE